MAESVTIAAVWQPLSKLDENDFFTQTRFQQEHANPSVYDRYFELVEAQLAKANQRKTKTP